MISIIVYFSKVHLRVIGFLCVCVLIDIRPWKLLYIEVMFPATAVDHGFLRGHMTVPTSLISQGNDAGNAVCQGWPGVHFPEMVGRLEGKAVRAFGALNLPLKNSPDMTCYAAGEVWSRGGLLHVHRGCR